MADITQMGISAPPMAAAQGTELGMGVPGMPPPQLHHDHNGPQEQPHDHQPHEGLGQEQLQPLVGAEDVVKLFGFITSEFRGFLAHVEHAVQVQTLSSVYILYSCHAWHTYGRWHAWRHRQLSLTRNVHHAQRRVLLLLLLLLLLPYDCQVY
jgi:hypothetical protein